MIAASELHIAQDAIESLVEEIKKAAGEYARDCEHPAVFLLLLADGNVARLPVSFTNDRDKDAVAYALRATCALVGAVAVVSVMESWVTTLNPGKEPVRREVLGITTESLFTATTMDLADIGPRGADGKRTIGEWSRMPAGGEFAGLLPQIEPTPGVSA